MDNYVPGQFTRGISAAPVTPESLGITSNAFYYVLIFLSYCLSLYLMPKVWKSSCQVLEKIFWSIVLLIPLLGPIFFGAFNQLDYK